jgi:predicted nucleotidyltransferase
MSSRPDLEPLLLIIEELTALLESLNIPHVIIGGIASSFLGRPRMTKDIDVLVILDNEKWPDLIEQASKAGFDTRISESLKFARENRVLLLRHRQSSIEIDISFGLLPFEKEAIRNKTIFAVKGISVPLPSPEDLIIMKALPSRSKDLEDIEGIINANPDINLRRIRRYVKEFSEILTMPEISEKLEKILSGKQKRPKGKRIRQSE